VLFVITAFDRPGALELRLKVRPAHLSYLEDRATQVRIGAPLLNENDQPMGSLLIIEAADRAAAEAFAAGDPYRQEGVFEKVEIRPWRAAVGGWIA
jgi:uncharacterized protein YciI